MAYWLIKSEPFKYSWDQFTKDKRADIKANTNLSNMDLVRLGRLSVQTVKEDEWIEVMKMSEGK